MFFFLLNNNDKKVVKDSSLWWFGDYGQLSTISTYQQTVILKIENEWCDVTIKHKSLMGVSNVIHFVNYSSI